MRKLAAVAGAVAVLGVIGWRRRPVMSPGGRGKAENEYLEKYDFDSLRKRGGRPSKIRIEGGLSGVEARRKYKVDFESRQFSFESEGKRITGMINYWQGQRRPAIIMLRGYADKQGYYTGFGSWRVADELAKSGLVTVSIDFLGFGGSSREAVDMLEARFEKVPAVMDLIESVKQLEVVDGERIGLWAHSNGGQIALSVLEVTGESYPTVLWAPMTNPFPKSVLETASSLDDGGRRVMEAIREFEKRYDSRRYAFENYYDWLKAPVVIHQGTGDYWCRLEWQEKVVEELRKRGKEAWLYVYKGDDHNLSVNWDEAVSRDISFFRQRLGF